MDTARPADDPAPNSHKNANLRWKINKSLYLSRIEGSPPKRNAPGSSPGKDAICRNLYRFRLFVFASELLGRQVKKYASSANWVRTVFLLFAYRISPFANSGFFVVLYV